GRSSVYDACISSQKSVTAVQLNCIHRKVADVLSSGEFAVGIKFQAEAWPAGMKLDALNHLRASIGSHQNICRAQQRAIAVCAVEHAVRNTGAAACPSATSSAGSAAAGRRCNLSEIYVAIIGSDIGLIGHTDGDKGYCPAGALRIVGINQPGAGRSRI